MMQTSKCKTFLPKSTEKKCFSVDKTNKVRVRRTSYDVIRHIIVSYFMGLRA